MIPYIYIITINVWLMGNICLRGMRMLNQWIGYFMPYELVKYYDPTKLDLSNAMSIGKHELGINF